jgi:hypothetical protein
MQGKRGLIIGLDQPSTLTVRDEALRWTADFAAVRARMGMPV